MATLYENKQTLINILSTKRSVRDFFEELHIEDIEKMINIQRAIHKERIEEVEKARIEAEAKKEKINLAKSKLEELGLSVEDLLVGVDVSNIVEPKKRRTRRSPDKVNFLYLDANGDVVHDHRPNSGRFGADFNAYLKKTGADKDALIFSDEEVKEALHTNILPTAKTVETDEERDARIQAELGDRVEEDIDVDDESESFGNK